MDGPPPALWQKLQPLRLPGQHPKQERPPRSEAEPPEAPGQEPVPCRGEGNVILWHGHLQPMNILTYRLRAAGVQHSGPSGLLSCPRLSASSASSRTCASASRPPRPRRPCPPAGRQSPKGKAAHGPAGVECEHEPPCKPLHIPKPSGTCCLAVFASCDRMPCVEGFVPGAATRTGGKAEWVGSF